MPSLSKKWVWLFGDPQDKRIPARLERKSHMTPKIRINLNLKPPDPCMNPSLSSEGSRPHLLGGSWMWGPSQGTIYGGVSQNRSKTTELIFALWQLGGMVWGRIFIKHVGIICPDAGVNHALAHQDWLLPSCGICPSVNNCYFHSMGSSQMLIMAVSTLWDLPTC